MKRVELTENYFRDWWLLKCYGINCEGVVKRYPRLCKTPKWFTKYPVTQEIHDEWYDWAIKEVQKRYRCSKKYAKRSFCFMYLNTAPDIIKNEKVSKT